MTVMYEMDSSSRYFSRTVRFQGRVSAFSASDWIYTSMEPDHAGLPGLKKARSGFISAESTAILFRCPLDRYDTEEELPPRQRILPIITAIP